MDYLDLFQTFIDGVESETLVEEAAQATIDSVWRIQDCVDSGSTNLSHLIQRNGPTLMTLTTFRWTNLKQYIKVNK